MGGGGILCRVKHGARGPSDLSLAVTAARRAATLLREALGKSAEVEFKGEVDPVTEVDRRAEAEIRRMLMTHRPSDDIVGEEEGGVLPTEGRAWIIDPLDGTVNFIHGLAPVSVSVALWEDGAPLVGVVIEAIHGEEFTAVRGEGAWLDSQPISVSCQAALSQALVGTGFPYDRRERAHEYAALIGAVLAESQGIRRRGSAALDLCYVAVGRFDAFWEQGLAVWDMAAGILMVEEAGGKVTGLDGRKVPLDGSAVIATNGLVHDQFAKVLAGAVG
ncbi:MAG: inositol monophosphatase [Acidimicrobiia bacterium]|nr:inositol monophosphatase [Acidimicrobiia bacterium]MXY74492.1 inositol monophosphatase [Acidimicrobiia bacterium]MYG93012.1 inositol monophosphatase [Acidimicrobiia bacterium]